MRDREIDRQKTDKEIDRQKTDRQTDVSHEYPYIHLK